MFSFESEMIAMDKNCKRILMEEEFVAQLYQDDLSQQLRSGFLTIGNQHMPFKKILMGNFSLWIPEEFELMNQAQLEKKYPYQSRAAYIFTDPYHVRDICFTYFIEELNVDQQGNAVDEIFAARKNLHPEMNILKEKKWQISDNTFYSLETILPTLEEEIYHFFAVCCIQRHLAFYSFSSLKSEKKFWSPLCIAIVSSLEEAYG